jgi:hypothetical protein
MSRMSREAWLALVSRARELSLLCQPRGFEIARKKLPSVRVQCLRDLHLLDAHQGTEMYVAFAPLYRHLR